MEGRRSRTKPAAEVENEKSQKRATENVLSPPQGKSVADDRCVPTVGGENKRKRAPRGPAGRNVKAKVEDEAKADEEVSVSTSGGGLQVPTKQEEDNRSGTENDEAGGVNSTERRRGSSRLRIRPVKFRESVLTSSSSKVKGEPQEKVENVGTKGAAAAAPAPKARDDSLVQLVPSTVDTRELIARIFSSRKDLKTKPAPEPPTIAPVVPKSPDTVGLKNVLSALKRVMKMKEAEPFNKPVDPVKLGIPDYLAIVKRPMDLGTIRNRLEKGEVYNTVNDVFADVSLVWSNCRMYNDDGDPIMELLQNLESTFNKLCLEAGSPFVATNTAEADLEKSKGEGLHQQKPDTPKVSKKKKVKDTQPDTGVSLKTKIKRSAPVDQVMAESKAREQKGNVDGVNLGDQDRDVKSMGVSSIRALKQIETTQAEQGSEDDEAEINDQETQQGPMVTPPAKEAGSAPTRYHRKSTSSTPVNMPAKVKRPSGHSTLTHRQGCLCVVCVGRRKREAKLRKSGAHFKANKSAKKKPGGPNSGDTAVEAEEDANPTEDADDILEPGYSENPQGFTSANFQLPLRKLDPYVLEMSRILLGSKPGSIWNRPRSLGYVPVLHPARRVGLADAISSFSKSY